MTKNTTAYMFKNDVYNKTSFEVADGTTIKDIATSGIEGMAVYEILINANTLVAKDIIIYLNDGVQDIPLKYASIPAAFGMSNAFPDPSRFIQSPTNFIANRVLDRDQNYCIPLPVGYKLRMKVTSSMVSGQVLTVITQCKEF